MNGPAPASLTAAKPVSDAAMAEAWFEEAFGMSPGKYERKRHGRFPLAYISNAKRIIDRSGVVKQLETWHAEERKSSAGRPATISFEAVLILFLMEVQVGRGMVFTELATTLKHRLRRKQLALIGITRTDGSEQDWYDRIWRSSQKLMKLVDSRPGRRNRILRKEGEYQAEIAKRDPAECAKKLTRMDWLCNQLIDASVSYLPRDLWRRFKGNTAIDATCIPVQGAAGNPGERLPPHLPRRSIDYDASYWKRTGNHEGTGRKGEVFGYEAEIAAMTRNNPNEPQTFPFLATAVGFHNPGKTRGAGMRMLDSLHERGFPVGYLLSDRAYVPGADPETLQAPARARGWKFVADYKVTDMGNKASHARAIQVEGIWYVKYMPTDLVNAWKDYREKKIDKETRDGRLISREQYRLKPKGHRDKQGYQRFLYPDPNKYLAYDQLTHKLIKKPTTPKTVTIPPSAGIKRAQEFVYKSATWRRWYGMRNTIESINKSVKDPTKENIADPGRRQGRGFTFAYLATTLALVSMNLRKIHSFIRDLLQVRPKKAKARAPRRTDSLTTMFTGGAATTGHHPPPA
ncbi:hypothetical protein [Homoserinimonas sp. OAct 916]|uniref:hypothetical protein n=1 Tax=Homoserinimonas sp. OAct 916 TaxID=2211450 RepID=UPI000DBEA63E|nr:hypothetical protein [Homoserinimonas sp. OAct 916]